MLNKKTFGILLLIWVIVILVLSLMPPKNVDELPKIPHLDKVAHFVFYFIFTILFFLTFQNNKENVKKVANIYILSFVVAFSLGICIEWLQNTITQDRSGDLFDVLFNTFGTVVALIGMKYINKKLLINVK
ncbi:MULTISPECIES: VanZ family protein [Capnocytophaga]|uniref:VanZ-like protein n=2 Tax=Capnocytophaga canis TaxID=1848903 RepID=A0A0B7I9S6_9FLAO|nr:MULTISPECIES: VanZ family protein [Capnocytophaga]CEN42497.1 VanZ-like protein [Capnocytophaga canis]CEN46628.1 VanZ-like protein [Capnocytophaga canis]CEN50641.1 VanZ-like protein [Capnocytophaga canis]